MILPYKNLFSYFKGGIFMFIIFKADYFGIENGDLFDENGNIKYNINIDDMTHACFFVSYMNTEEETKRFCEVRNQYNKLVGSFDDSEPLYYYSYCKYYEEIPIHTIIKMKIDYKTYEKDYCNEIEIRFNVIHPDKISKYLLDKFKFMRYNEDDDYPILHIVPKENESPEDLLNRGLDKCVEFIKNHKFKDDKKIYTYKDFLKYNEEENEGGIYYSRWDYTDMIHIEDRFKD